MYRERKAAALAGAVIWTQRRHADTVADLRVLPDGCMDLIWTAGELLVAGPDTTAQLVPGRAGDTYVGVRFAPGTAPVILGVPAWELRDLRVPLRDPWPDRLASELADRLGGAASPPAELEAVVTEVAAGAGYPGSLPDRVPDGVLRGLRRGLQVDELADELVLSERQLRRRCLDAFGYGPKTLGRILRLGQALRRARAGLPFAQVALAAGYADQAHLAREVRALAGVSLRKLLVDESAG